MRIRSTSQRESWVKKFDVILGHLHWIVLCVSACFFVSTIFITERLLWYHNRYHVIKISLVFSAVEFLGLSSLYAWLIWHSQRYSTSLSSYYQLVLALVPSLLGCVSATCLSFLGSHRINWVLALWVSVSWMDDV